LPVAGFAFGFAAQDRRAWGLPEQLPRSPWSGKACLSRDPRRDPPVDLFLTISRSADANGQQLGRDPNWFQAHLKRAGKLLW
jgi:hypothetical protein